jgi:regulator of protease activity HflC (stomatin/prohibitin superfamily)
MDLEAGSVPHRVYAEPVGGHVSLGRSLRLIIHIVITAALGLPLAYAIGGTPSEATAPKFFGTLAVVLFLVGVVVRGIRVAAQWERGVILRLGRFMGVKGPGILYIIPVLDFVRFVDTRVLALNIPSQKVITKDNVPAEIDGALFFRVSDAGRAVTVIQDYQFAIAQYAQASLRDVIGGLSLDELLTEREQIQQRIAASLEERIKEWGVHVDSIRLLDIEMPEDLKRMMSRQASAEREKRATITKAEGDKLAAANLAEAAATMARSPGAMQLRTLQTVDGLGPTPSNTVVLYPVELVQAVTALLESIQRKKLAAEKE